MKIKSVPRKILANKLLHMKMELLNEHSTMMYNHLDAAYMRTRAKEEIMTDGNLKLAAQLIIMAEIKDEAASRSK